MNTYNKQTVCPRQTQVTGWGGVGVGSEYSIDIHVRKW